MESYKIIKTFFWSSVTIIVFYWQFLAIAGTKVTSDLSVLTEIGILLVVNTCLVALVLLFHTEEEFED